MGHIVLNTAIIACPLHQIMQQIEAASDRDILLELAEKAGVDQLMAAAEAATLAGFGQIQTYSRKVFIPLTRLCRDACGYCTFATTPRNVAQPYLSRDEVLAIARAGVEAGCREALFTLGDEPEARYAVAREALAELGHETTLSYVAEMADAVFSETGLLPHINAGLLSEDDLAMLRPVSASMGLMLETASARLMEPGEAHHGCKTKTPSLRFATIEAAGRAQVPFTTGLLIGIGETRHERVDALLQLRASHRRHGHIQEILIQNFRAKSDTRLAARADASLDEHLWTIAMARLIFGSGMTIQAPPNLQADNLGPLIRAGVNDWGGVSPITPDHVNPEAPWPELEALEQTTAQHGRLLRQRLAIGPTFAREPGRWAAPAIATVIRRGSDGRGLARTDAWRAGSDTALPTSPFAGPTPAGQIGRLVDRAMNGRRLDEADVAALFEADGAEVNLIVEAADELRRSTVGDDVTYVINRNINYTNICLYHCAFCAFSKGSTRAERGPAYRLDLDEISRRSAEAAARGATEVCLQGGIHPNYDGETYRAILGAVRDAAPSLHIHAFSPLEISHGATSSGLDYGEYLAGLNLAGLSSLPGTAAEILDDEIRAFICPDKVSTAQWLAIMRAAHGVGLRSTATVMFGHVEGYQHWARHLLAIRDLQEETGGFTEFVPLPFVHMDAPMWRKGMARSGPSWRETLLMHAVARLVLHPLIPNIQGSWVKLGRAGMVAVLKAGVNDLGGTLMDESITRAAGGRNGQMFDIETMHELAGATGRSARQRTTLYRSSPPLSNKLIEA